VHRLLRRCSEKDPKQRLRDIGEARYLLEEPVSAPSRSRLGWIAAAIFAAIALVVTLIHFRAAPASQHGLRLSVPLPENSSVIYLELSPDSKRLALVLSREDKWQIYLRALDSDELQPLSGTEGGQAPFWSPDSRFVGFFADGKLKIIPGAGGPAQVLCEAGYPGGGTWARNGVILFGDGSGLRRVDAKGGQCSVVGKSEPGNMFPLFLPDGNHFFYLRQSLTDEASSGVFLATFEEPIGRKVLSDPSSVIYTAPASRGGRAHLLFLRGSAMMAQPFDDAVLQPVGDPFVVVARASPSLAQFSCGFSRPGRHVGVSRRPFARDAADVV
jgi:hypothetical protein